MGGDLRQSVPQNGRVHLHVIDTRPPSPKSPGRLPGKLGVLGSWPFLCSPWQGPQGQCPWQSPRQFPQHSHQRPGLPWQSPQQSPQQFWRIRAWGPCSWSGESCKHSMRKAKEKENADIKNAMFWVQGLQSGRPATGVLNGNSLEVLWKVLPRVLWEIGVLRKVLPRVLWEIGVLQKVLPRVLFLCRVIRKSTLGSTFWSTPISHSTLGSTFRSTPISHSTLGSTFQSTSREFPFSTPVAGRPDCNPGVVGHGKREPETLLLKSFSTRPFQSPSPFTTCWCLVHPHFPSSKGFLNYISAVQHINLISPQNAGNWDLKSEIGMVRAIPSIKSPPMFLSDNSIWEQ